MSLQGPTLHAVYFNVWLALAFSGAHGPQMCFLHVLIQRSPHGGLIVVRRGQERLRWHSLSRSTSLVVLRCLRLCMCMHPVYRTSGLWSAMSDRCGEGAAQDGSLIHEGWGSAAHRRRAVCTKYVQYAVHNCGARALLVIGHVWKYKRWDAWL